MRNSYGMSLVELIIAMGVLTVVVTAIASVTVFVSRGTQSNRIMLRSTKYINEQTDLVRVFRDSRTWEEFIQLMENKNCINYSATDNRICYMDSSNGLTVQSGAKIYAESSADRVSVSFGLSYPEDSNTNLVRVSSVAQWQVGTQPKTLTNTIDLSNWQEQLQ